MLVMLSNLWHDLGLAVSGVPWYFWPIAAVAVLSKPLSKLVRSYTK